MSWTVETPVRIGTAVFAAISEARTAAQNTDRHIGAWGCKQPVLILECERGRVRGVDLDGVAYSETEIEVLYPGALDQLRALLRTAT